MTRVYALRMLLRHGAMGFTELRETTGWTAAQLSSALQGLEKKNQLLTFGCKMKMTYAIPQVNQWPAVAPRGV